MFATYLAPKPGIEPGTFRFGAESREQRLLYLGKDRLSDKGLRNLKGNRTRCRNLLAKELAKGKILLQDVEQESSYYMRDVSNCIKRLNEFITKLEEANEKLSIAIDGRDGAQEIEEIIKEDWYYISTVMDCRNELVDIQNSDQRSPADNSYSVTVTEDKFDQVILMTSQMQQVILGQQQFNRAKKQNLLGNLVNL